MSSKIMETFDNERARLNEIVMRYAGQEIKRFYSLDHQAYRDGALPGKIKELMGFVASLALRCDDCIKYHVGECHRSGVSDAEFEEAAAIGLVVGSSIAIPHLRRAYEAWDELKRQ